MEKKKIDKNRQTCTYIVQNQQPCGKKSGNIETGRCIFHCNQIEKKKTGYNDAFWQEFERQKKQGKLFDFTGFVFPEDISFEGIVFEKEVIFNNAQFHGKVRFNRAEFEKEVSFLETKFHDAASFWNTQFYDRVDFGRCTFPEAGADFRQAHFTWGANFASTQFHGKMDIEGSIFVEKADFRWNTFFADAIFRDAQFSENAIFAGSRFLKTADFRQVRFYRDTVFTEAQFHEKASFWAAEFKKKTDFSKTRFDAEADFVSAHFKGETIFNQARFNEIACFDNAEFYDNENCFMEECYFYDISGLLETIEQDRKKEKEKKTFQYSKRSDKTEFLPDHFRLILGDRASAKYPLIDRQIKDDLYLDSFKKKYPYLHFWWWLFTDCGRSILKLSIWCFGAVFSFAALYWGFMPDAFNNPMGAKPISFLYFSFVTFTTLGFGDITPLQWYAQLVVIIEVVLGYGALGLLISIMANKFARRS